MGVNEDIRTAILEISKTYKNQYSELCFVKSVNSTAKTCDCVSITVIEDGETYLTTDADFLNVLLMANTDTGFYIVPKVGSYVVVTMIEQFGSYVAMYSSVDEIQLNGSNYSGLVKIADLVTKLNNLENKVNDLITFSATHVHSGVTTGGGSSAVSPTPVAGALTPTVQANLENLTVKQGNGL